MDKNPKGWVKRRALILRRDNHTCQQCGQTEGQLHVDHIIPRRLNGTEDVNNLVTLCRACNLKKGGFFILNEAPPTLQAKDLPENVSVSHD